MPCEAVGVNANDSYTETIKAYGHDYECTEEKGYYLYTCKNCGDSYTESSLAALAPFLTKAAKGLWKCEEEPLTDERDV